MTTTPVGPATRRDSSLLNGTRVLLGLFGAFKLYGTAYFTFVATAEQGGDPQGLGDWAVVVWSTALAIAFLVAAVRLGRDRRVLPALVGVLLLDLVFSTVKLTVYDEPEAVAFMAVDLVILGLLSLISRRTLGGGTSPGRGCRPQDDIRHRVAGPRRASLSPPRRRR